MDRSGRAQACAARLLAALGVAAQIATAACRGDSPAPSPGALAGFPSWEERVLLEWTNRARADPAAELAPCRDCPERACYSPVPPLEWSLALNRSARFHADEMLRQRFFLHDSPCRLASDIDARYPGRCDGSRACACARSGTTRFSERLELFGVARPSGEVQAQDPGGPGTTFHDLLYEPASSPECASRPENGHRWNLLKLAGTVGFGVRGSYTVGDFSRSAGPGRPVVSGAHYPRQGETVEFWASWYAPAGPSRAFVAVDRTCAPLKLARGGPTNGAWAAAVSGLASGCHRYLFEFHDAKGSAVTYPEKGSFGVGPASCADADESRPAHEPACR